MTTECSVEFLDLMKQIIELQKQKDDLTTQLKAAYEYIGRNSLKIDTLEKNVEVLRRDLQHYIDSDIENRIEWYDQKNTLVRETNRGYSTANSEEDFSDMPPLIPCDD